MAVETQVLAERAGCTGSVYWSLEYVYSIISMISYYKIWPYMKQLKWALYLSEQFSTQNKKHKQ